MDYLTLLYRKKMAPKVKSREDLVSAIAELRKEDQTNWENVDLDSFLEALSAWITDCDGYYKNQRIDLNPDDPSWQIFADALSAATIYE